MIIVLKVLVPRWLSDEVQNDVGAVGEHARAALRENLADVRLRVRIEHVGAQAKLAAERVSAFIGMFDGRLDETAANLLAERAGGSSLPGRILHRFSGGALPAS